MTLPAERPPRVAVDIGGTFTDLVLVQGGRAVANAKVLTTPDDPSLGVENGLRRLLKERQPSAVEQILHATTLATNALIERKGARTALITTKGFRDVLTIRRELRFDLYDLFLEMPPALVPRRLRWEVEERLLGDGEISASLDKDEVRRLAHVLVENEVEAVGVSFLHSYRNPVHEHLVRSVLAEEAPEIQVSLSCEVAPEIGEFARTSTVVANAYVRPLVARYLDRLEDRLRRLNISAPLLIMLSTGGGALATAQAAAEFPVRLLESGPAAGALAAAFWGHAAGFEDVLAFDMGGTTAKACLIENGQPIIARQFEAARIYRFTKGSGLPIQIPVIDLIETGAGGGSIARVGAFNLPEVGPDSTGSVPGPACYGNGGVEATVTDADLVLGYLNPEYFLGGELVLQDEVARKAVGRLGDQLGLTVQESAAAIHRMVNENMANAARMHAIERGRDVTRFALVATGGAGPVHAWGVAKSLGIRRLVFPPGAGVASAFGMLTAAPGFEFARSVPAVLDDINWDEIRGILADLVDAGMRQLELTGVTPREATVSLAADIKYQGQGDTVSVELGEGLGADPASQVQNAFEDAYTKLYSRRPQGVQCELVTWRIRVTGPSPTLDVTNDSSRPAASRKPSRKVWFAESAGYVETDVLDRYSLKEEDLVQGPAIVEERESTVVIGPGGTAEVDAVGNLVVNVSMDFKEGNEAKSA